MSEQQSPYDILMNRTQPQPGMSAFGTAAKFDPTTGKMIQGGSQGWLAPTMGAVTGLAGAVTGWKNYELGKEQAGMQNKFAQANLSNQAGLAQYELQKQANIGKAGAGQDYTAAKLPVLQKTV